MAGSRLTAQLKERAEAERQRLNEAGREELKEQFSEVPVTGYRSAAERTRAIASSLADDALATITAIMLNQMETGDVRVRAATELLHRGIGRHQTYVTDIQDDFQNMPPTEAYSKLIGYVMAGKVSLEQAAVIKTLLETQVNMSKVDELEDTIAQLSAQLDAILAEKAEY